MEKSTKHLYIWNLRRALLLFLSSFFVKFKKNVAHYRKHFIFQRSSVFFLSPPDDVSVSYD